MYIYIYINIYLILHVILYYIIYNRNYVCILVSFGQILEHLLIIEFTLKTNYFRLKKLSIIKQH